MREYSRRAYLKNKPAILARQKERREENPEASRAYAREMTSRYRAKLKAINPPTPPPTPHERFLQNIKVNSESGCWEWLGVITKKGYARMKIAQQPVAMHRWSYVHHKGPIPEGMQIDHICHSKDARCIGGDKCLHRRCVNPAHLEPVTGTVNTRRGRESYWANADITRPTHCPTGHEYTPENSILSGEEKQYRSCRTCQRLGDKRRRSEALP